MKLICDCGNVEEFELPNDPEDRFTEEGYEHCDKKHWSFELSSGHDELFISCNKCNKQIHLWA